jgi:hypothetical protein
MTNVAPDDDRWAELMEEEGRFYAAVRLALDRHEDDPATGTMSCPICGNVMDALRRGRRWTGFWWEEACIQVQCDPCGFGGEISGAEGEHRR